MQRWVARGVEVRLPIGPYQQKAVRRNNIAGRDQGLQWFGQRVAQVVAGQVGGNAAGVVELEPILGLANVGRTKVEQRVGVARHPFIDPDRERWRVIGRAGRHDAEHRPVEGLAVGIIPVGLVDRQAGIVEVIDDLRLAIHQSRERQRAGAGAETETRVQFSGRALARLSVGPDDQELMGIDRRTRRKRPFGEVRVVVRQVKAVQAHQVGAGVVEFQPRIMLAQAVNRPADVLGLHFIQPERIVRRQAPGGTIRYSRCRHFKGGHRLKEIAHVR